MTSARVLATRELDLPEANMYPSLTLAGGRLYVLNDQGDALVLEPGREYKELKRNRLADGNGGGPAIDGKCMYGRGAQHLYCIGEK